MLEASYSLSIAGVARTLKVTPRGAQKIARDLRLPYVQTPLGKVYDAGAVADVASIRAHNPPRRGWPKSGRRNRVASQA